MAARRLISSSRGALTVEALDRLRFRIQAEEVSGARGLKSTKGELRDLEKLEKAIDRGSRDR